ncbi:MULTISPECIES: DUF2811 domain-containing protein [unclassified Prochlorococcus]|uniref:DUF2811 domain-containing protein n=1 Tax=unclassified Prochlorococcus TaxID=2627481 RepID=UPI0005338C42|nr:MULTISPECIES: DUF2811 domain-containing protein [unclassified Prochlorococcus]KGG15122.1 hypothetical protein EV06_0987 [Prochlorococcus sp. MIT 0602]KGG17394.1 hypothetical protein EV07_0833 [Prochlorococcus sp. MIT 0603]
MDQAQLKAIDTKAKQSFRSDQSLINLDNDLLKIEQAGDIASSVSIETEIPEVLYRGMKQFISTNSKWDQYRLMSSALANFLFQNGCDDRAITERYLDDLFNMADS